LNPGPDFGQKLVVTRLGFTAVFAAIVGHMPDFEIVLTPHPASPDRRHPAAVHLAATLHQLVAAAPPITMPDGTTRRMRPRRVHELLAQRVPGQAVSQSQVYRYFAGTATPNTIVIWALAGIFTVSPRVFVPDTTT